MILPYSRRFETIKCQAVLWYVLAYAYRMRCFSRLFRMIYKFSPDFSQLSISQLRSSLLAFIPFSSVSCSDKWWFRSCLGMSYEHTNFSSTPGALSSHRGCSFRVLHGLLLSPHCKRSKSKSEKWIPVPVEWFHSAFFPCFPARFTFACSLRFLDLSQNSFCHRDKLWRITRCCKTGCGSSAKADASLRCLWQRRKWLH